MKEAVSILDLNGLAVRVKYTHDVNYEDIQIISVIEPNSEHDMTNIISDKERYELIDQLS